MTKYRIETDSMGDVEVPEDALYGAQTQRAVNNFTISQETVPWSMIDAILHIKYCAATVNKKLHLLSSDHARAICKAAAALLKEKPVEQFPVPILQTGSGTSTNMNVNEVIAIMAKQDDIVISPNDHVNLGQSSNDVIPTAMLISASRILVKKLLPALKDLSSAIRNFAQKNKAVIKTGRTHLMDALPVRLFDECEAWALQVDESHQRFLEVKNRLLRLPLGGTAVGSGVNCHPDFPADVFKLLSERIGLAYQASDSSFKGQSSLDTIVELSGHMKTCATVLSKIANDLRWMNSGPNAGLSEIQLPPLQPGSSIMPAKINPIIPEAVLMAMAQVIGNDTTITLAGTGGSFQLNTMLPIASAKTNESLELLAGSCESLGTKCFLGMRVLRENTEKPIARNPILVTSLNPLIGYEKSAQIGKIAQQEQRPILEVALEYTDIEKAELEKLLDPQLLANGGKVPE